MFHVAVGECVGYFCFFIHRFSRSRLFSGRVALSLRVLGCVV
jgi:hypothetical protein